MRLCLLLFNYYGVLTIVRVAVIHEIKSSKISVATDILVKIISHTLKKVKYFFEKDAECLLEIGKMKIFLFAFLLNLDSFSIDFFCYRC